MGRFTRDPDIDELEERLDNLKIESTIEDTKLSIEKSKAMQKELKRKYGKRWRKNLGAHGNDPNTNTSLEQFANARFRIS